MKGIVSLIFVFRVFCCSMTTEEQKGNDEKECNATQQGETFCLAKLYGMKDADDWEEIYVGLCAVSKAVCYFELS